MQHFLSHVNLETIGFKRLNIRTTQKKWEGSDTEVV